MSTVEKCDMLLISLRKIIRAIDLHSKKLMRLYGLTGPQMLLLKTVCCTAVQGVTTKELADKISLSTATVTSILDRLCERGFAERVKCGTDKRKTFIRATAKTQSIFASNPALLQEFFIEKFSALKSWEQSQLLLSLERISDMMQATELDATPLLSSMDMPTEG